METKNQGLRKSYFIGREEVDYVFPNEYNEYLYDPRWIGSTQEKWVIPRVDESNEAYEELRSLFNVIRKGFNSKLPRKMNGEVYLVDRETDNYGNVFCVITEEEERKRLFPHSITIAYHSDNLEFMFARNINVARQLVETLLKESLPEIEFQWEHIPTSEEIEEERRRMKEQQKLERLKRSITDLDYEILNRRKKGLSLWQIGLELNVSMNVVVHRLKKMYLASQKIPELLEGWDLKFQPLSRQVRKEKGLFNQK